MLLRIRTGWRNSDISLCHIYLGFSLFLCEDNHFFWNMNLHLFWINVLFPSESNFLRILMCRNYIFYIFLSAFNSDISKQYLITQIYIFAKSFVTCVCHFCAKIYCRSDLCVFFTYLFKKLCSLFRQTLMNVSFDTESAKRLLHQTPADIQLHLWKESSVT